MNGCGDMGGILLVGSRVTIRDFSLEDAFSMRSWGEHENPLLEDYNFPYCDGKDIEEWFLAKTFGLSKKYFSVYNEQNKFVGYLGMKQIRHFKKESTLGIVFDPNYLNKGYGTEALNLFLDFYFNDLKMNIMYLEVAEFNKRARRCYEKCGFIEVSKYLDKYFDDFIDFDNPYVKEAINCFVIKHNKIYNYVYKMKIDKKTYFRLH